ncbi:MAG: His/Gly/Thr/Pro-type tRNA ligase C-terminal domain-containing protein [Fidelibacterota bacterium]
MPIMLILGEKEQIDGSVSIRRRFEGDIGVQKIDDFLNDLLSEIKGKIRRDI